MWVSVRQRNVKGMDQGRKKNARMGKGHQIVSIKQEREKRSVAECEGVSQGPRDGEGRPFPINQGQVIYTKIPKEGLRKRWKIEKGKLHIKGL